VSVTLTPTFPVPVEDPVPSLTERFAEAGAFQRSPTGLLTDDAVAAMRGTIQSVVTGLQSDEKPFRAVFGRSATAYTDIASRLVHIGTKMMDDPTISDGHLAAAMVGLAYHEVAHINYDRDFRDAVARATAGHPLMGMAVDLHNIAQDVRIEYNIRRAMPGYADCLDVAMHHINGVPLRNRIPAVTGLSTKAARSLFFGAVRAPWVVADWSDAPEVRAWGDDWARRFERTDDPTAIGGLMVEALDMVLSWTVKSDDDETPPPPPIDEPPPVEPPPIDEPPIDEPPIDEPPPVGPKGPGEDKDPDEPPPNGPLGPSGDDEDEPEEGEDEPKGGDDPDDEVEEGDDPTYGDPEDGETEDPWGNPATDPVKDRDSSGDWSDRSDKPQETPTTNPAVNETQGAASDKSLEDLDLPACAGDAAKGVNDTRYENTAARIAKSREASNIRVISTPGWPDRQVRRIRDWNGTSLTGDDE
jgi:hypothetical protein